MSSSEKQKKPNERPTSQPRMHHYLPISYLKRFVDSKGFLHVFDFDQRRTFSAGPQKVAKIRDFYTAETIEQKEDTELESILCGFENRARPAIDNIIQNRCVPLGTAEWMDVCNFVALLDCRLPILRERSQEIGDYFAKMIAEMHFGTKEKLEATLKHIKDTHGEEIDLDFESAREILDEGCIALDIPQNWHIQMTLDAASRLAPLIFEMKPHLLVSENEKFITGDCPLPKRLRESSHLMGAGWSSPAVEIALPLSAHHCLVFTWDKNPRVLLATPFSVAHVNFQVAYSALRFVFAPDEVVQWVEPDGSINQGSMALFEKFCPLRANRRLVEVSQTPWK